MIDPLLRQQLLYWMSQIVYVQLYAIGVISFIVLGLLAYRQWKSKRMDTYKQSYSEIVVEEMLLRMDMENAQLIMAPTRLEWIKRQSLKQTLQEQIQALSGVDKQSLVTRYFELGFAQQDLKLCMSMFWWNRLEGVSNLRLLGRDKLAPFFQYLKKDKHELVVATALLALSELNHDLNKINFDDLTPLLDSGRQSALSEMATSWCRIYGFETVFNAAVDCHREDLRTHVISSILGLRTPDSVPVICEYLAEAHYHTPRLLSDLIMGLKEVANEDVLDTIGEYAFHFDERVQLSAIDFMLRHLPEEDTLRWRLIETDPSPKVQRYLSQWRTKREKAV